MGRGRAKAKQQKVARELKYNSQSTDFNALQRELSNPSSSHYEDVNSDDESYEDDKDDDDGDWAASAR